MRNSEFGIRNGFRKRSLLALLLIFCLLYTPCVAAIASVKRELGGKWAAGVVVGQGVIAWLMAGLVYGMGSLFI